MYHYEAAGEQSSVFVANKLAYFLQRKGENLRLNFQAHYYGPYAVQVNHVLLHLNGTYLKGMEQNTAKPFEALQLNYDKYSEIERYINTKLKSEQKQRIDGVLSLIRRFESSYALELLATVDFIMDRDNAREVNQVIDSLSKWSSRKKNLFKSEHVQIAIDHLNKSASDIFTPLA